MLSPVELVSNSYAPCVLLQIMSFRQGMYALYGFSPDGEMLLVDP